MKMLTGFELTAEDNPVSTHVVGFFPVARPAAIMWSAAAQKSGVPHPGVYAKVGLLVQLLPLAAALW
jgi:hypothetical protein